MPEISEARYRAGEGEPLVLIHGFTATWRCWLPVLAELVPRFDVFAPTLHGHDGGPPPPDEGAFSLAGAADHLELLLDDQGIGAAHLAGNSMGGALALELAKRGRALSVVAISPGGGWREDDRATPAKIVKFFARTQRITKAAAPRLERVMRRPGTRRLALRDVMTRGDQVPAAEAVALARSSIRCAVVENVYDAVLSGSARVVDLDRVSCPVLVAWGDCDRILRVGVHSPRFRAEIAGVEFRVWPGVGHTPMWDDAALVSSTIAQFAASASGAAPEPAPLTRTG